MWELAFGEGTVDRTQVFERFSKFHSGKMSVKDADGLELPPISKTDAIAD
jgi:hypothetical protein